eukprot:COSAG01_NODE_2880_length_6917_cov_3.067908_1_plen_333_part_00
MKWVASLLLHEQRSPPSYLRDNWLSVSEPHGAASSNRLMFADVKALPLTRCRCGDGGGRWSAACWPTKPELGGWLLAGAGAGSAGRGQCEGSPMVDGRTGAGRRSGRAASHYTCASATSSPRPPPPSPLPPPCFSSSTCAYTTGLHTPGVTCISSSMMFLPASLAAEILSAPLPAAAPACHGSLSPSGSILRRPPPPPQLLGHMYSLCCRCCRCCALHPPRSTGVLVSLCCCPAVWPLRFAAVHARSIIRRSRSSARPKNAGRRPPAAQAASQAAARQPPPVAAPVAAHRTRQNRPPRRRRSEISIGGHATVCGGGGLCWRGLNHLTEVNPK